MASRRIYVYVTIHALASMPLALHLLEAEKLSVVRLLLLGLPDTPASCCFRLGLLTETPFLCAAGCRAVFGGLINTKPDGGLWNVPDGILQVMVDATGTIHDGNGLKTFHTRVYSFTVLANNRDTDLTGISLSAVDESKAKQGFPW
jgi:hypothetical protein